jgi:hypothetical protein
VLIIWLLLAEAEADIPLVAVVEQVAILREQQILHLVQTMLFLLEQVVPEQHLEHIRSMALIRNLQTHWH